MGYIAEDLYDKQTTEQIAVHVKEILRLLGENPEREGLLKTPERVAKSLQFLTKGYSQDGIEIVKSALFEEEYQQMVLVKDIELYSMCEHHLLPFYGKAHIAYISNGRVAGLSKLARTVEEYARRPQLQERLTSQIADAIMKYLHAEGVMVVVEAEHMCMTMRGVKKPGSRTMTYVCRGTFENDNAAMDRVLSMIKGI